jgi:hypothetical protein
MNSILLMKRDKMVVANFTDTDLWLVELGNQQNISDSRSSDLDSN